MDDIDGWHPCLIKGASRLSWVAEEIFNYFAE